MERPTLTLQTPAGKELVIKTYITAGERNAIRDVVLSDMEIDPSNFKQEQESITGVSKISGSVLGKQQRAVIEQVAVSYDGSSDDIYSRLEASSPAEFDFVVDEINKATGAKKA